MRSSEIQLRKLKLRLRDNRFANHKPPCTAIWQQPLQSVLALWGCSTTDLILINFFNFLKWMWKVRQILLRGSNFGLRFFYVPYIYDTGPTALLPFRRKSYLWFLRSEKNPSLPTGFEPADLGSSGKYDNQGTTGLTRDSCSYHIWGNWSKEFQNCEVQVLQNCLFHTFLQFWQHKRQAATTIFVVHIGSAFSELTAPLSDHTVAHVGSIHVAQLAVDLFWRLLLSVQKSDNCKNLAVGGTPVAAAGIFIWGFIELGKI